jgi:hypothetical protein
MIAMFKTGSILETDAVVFSHGKSKIDETGVVNGGLGICHYQSNNKLCNTFGLKDNLNSSMLVSELKQNTNYIVLTSVNKIGNNYSIKIKLYDMSDGFNLSTSSNTIDSLDYDSENKENIYNYTHEVLNGDYKQYLITGAQFGLDFGDSPLSSNANTLKYIYLGLSHENINRTMIPNNLSMYKVQYNKTNPIVQLREDDFDLLVKKFTDQYNSAPLESPLNDGSYEIILDMNNIPANTITYNLVLYNKIKDYHYDLDGFNVLAFFKTGSGLTDGDTHDYISYGRHFTIKRRGNRLNAVFDYTTNDDNTFNDPNSYVTLEDNKNYVVSLNVKKGGKNVLQENTFQIRFQVFQIIGNQKILKKDQFYEKVYPFGSNYSNPSDGEYQYLHTNYRSNSYTNSVVTDEVFRTQIIQGILYHSKIDILIDSLIDIENLVFEPIPIQEPVPIQLS